MQAPSQQPHHFCLCLPAHLPHKWFYEAKAVLYSLVVSLGPNGRMLSALPWWQEALCLLGGVGLVLLCALPTCVLVAAGHISVPAALASLLPTRPVFSAAMGAHRWLRRQLDQLFANVMQGCLTMTALSVSVRLLQKSGVEPL